MLANQATEDSTKATFIYFCARWLASLHQLPAPAEPPPLLMWIITITIIRRADVHWELTMHWICLSSSLNHHDNPREPVTCNNIGSSSHFAGGKNEDRQVKCFERDQRTSKWQSWVLHPVSVAPACILVYAAPSCLPKHFVATKTSPPTTNLNTTPSHFSSPLRQTNDSLGSLLVGLFLNQYVWGGQSYQLTTWALATFSS